MIVHAAAATPIANAGPDQTVNQTATVHLNGSASTGTTSFRWVQTGGPTVSLSGANTATPSFTAPKQNVALEVARIAAQQEAALVVGDRLGVERRLGDRAAVRHVGVVQVDLVMAEATTRSIATAMAVASSASSPPAANCSTWSPMGTRRLVRFPG